MVRILTSSVAALALVAVPTIASAAPAAGQHGASALSLSPGARAGSTKGKSTRFGGDGGIIVTALVAAGVVAGIVAAAGGFGGDDNDRPNSP